MHSVPDDGSDTLGDRRAGRLRQAVAGARRLWRAPTGPQVAASQGLRRPTELGVARPVKAAGDAYPYQGGETGTWTSGKGRSPSD